jgi:hypothetical protein
MRRQTTTLKALPPNQAHALQLVAAGARTSDVASTLGVHRATVWKWTQEREFQEAMQSIREEAWTILRDGLRNQAARAVFVLGELMESPDPRTRRDAARIVLGSYARLRPMEPPDEAPKSSMSMQEAEDRILDAWKFLQEEEAKRPGYLAAHPEFIQAKAWALEILMERSRVEDSPLIGSPAG